MSDLLRALDFTAAGLMARAAWQRTLGLYAERLGVSVDGIR